MRPGQFFYSPKSGVMRAGASTRRSHITAPTTGAFFFPARPLTKKKHDPADSVSCVHRPARGPRAPRAARRLACARALAPRVRGVRRPPGARSARRGRSTRSSTFRIRRSICARLKLLRRLFCAFASPPSAPTSAIITIKNLKLKFFIFSLLKFFADEAV